MQACIECHTAGFLKLVPSEGTLLCTRCGAVNEDGMIEDRPPFGEYYSMLPPSGYRWRADDDIVEARHTVLSLNCINDAVMDLALSDLEKELRRRKHIGNGNMEPANSRKALLVAFLMAHTTRPIDHWVTGAVIASLGVMVYQVKEQRKKLAHEDKRAVAKDSRAALVQQMRDLMTGDVIQLFEKKKRAKEAVLSSIDRVVERQEARTLVAALSCLALEADAMKASKGAEARRGVLVKRLLARVAAAFGISTGTIKRHTGADSALRALVRDCYERA